MSRRWLDFENKLIASGTIVVVVVVASLGLLSYRLRLFDKLTYQYAKWANDLGWWFLEHNQERAGIEWLTKAKNKRGWMATNNTQLELVDKQPFLNDQARRFELLTRKAGGVWPRYHLIEVLMQLGRWDEVASIAAEIKEIDPNSQTSQQVLRQVDTRLREVNGKE